MGQQVCTHSDSNSLSHTAQRQLVNDQTIKTLICDLWRVLGSLSDIRSGTSSGEKAKAVIYPPFCPTPVQVWMRARTVQLLDDRVAFRSGYADVGTMLVASSSATIIACGCICRLDNVHMWLTPPSMHFWSASALCEPSTPYEASVLTLVRDAIHSASRSEALPLRMLMFDGNISICEKKCRYMKLWYDSGCSRGRPTYSSCKVMKGQLRKENCLIIALDKLTYPHHRVTGFDEHTCQAGRYHWPIDCHGSINPQAKGHGRVTSMRMLRKEGFAPQIVEAFDVDRLYHDTPRGCHSSSRVLTRHFLLFVSHYRQAFSSPTRVNMAPSTEKNLHEVESASDSVGNGTTEIALPVGRKYRSTKIGPVTLPHYASPATQLVIVAFVCFLCPGMFNALSGMGGGGQVSANAADEANVALYACFSVVGFFAGSIVNYIGIRFSLSFGGLGYCIYVASFLCYSHTQNTGFNIFAGALLGCCAGMLWSAQGAIMMSYPPENSKGRYISWFWMIFNLGAVIGSLIPLGENINATSSGTVSDGTYIGFIVLTACGAALAWCLVDAKSVVRNDGSRIILMKNPTWNSMGEGAGEGVNLAYFNTRTRALNNTLYWTAQIVGAFVFGFCLDYSKIRRTVRAKIAWVAILILTLAIFGGGYDFQKGYTRESVSKDAHYVSKDWTDSGYIGPMFLYIFYGFYDAAWQTCVYWFMGSLTNNGRKLTNFAGFYKGIQSAGAVVIWRLDSKNLAYMSEFGSSWGLLLGALVCALPVLLIRVKDHVSVEEDVKFSDETVEEVIGTADGKAVVHDSEKA
ncbi:MFS general substrate transporter, partial [Aureobasidium melanogenum]